MPKTHNTSELHETRRARWYFGGISSATAACITHPFDLLKVQLQTQQEEKLNLFKIIAKVYKDGGANDKTKLYSTSFFYRIRHREPIPVLFGVTSFYNGLSASLLRQLTYTTARFGIYEVGKTYINSDSFTNKLFLATVAGCGGGLIGVPTDLVNVRMQNDMKLALDKRRNYRHVIDGLMRVYSEEGTRKMFTGGSLAIARGVLITIGQIAVYEQIKSILLLNFLLKDDVFTHLGASMFAACAATAMTQPLDVLKTRSMNAKPGEYKNVLDVFNHTARTGPLSFYKGFVPALMRLGPQTILTFLILEQMRIFFGYVPID